MKAYTQRLTDELNKFVEKERKKVGMSRNAYVRLCITKCKEMKEANKCDTK